MKRQAFTLIEMLVVMAIITILASLVVPSIYRSIEKAKENSYNTLIDMVESSAKLYVSRNLEVVQEAVVNVGIYEITLQELVLSNLLKEPIVDPRNDSEIPLTKKVKIIRKGDNKNVFIYCYEEKNCPDPYLDITPPVISLLGDNPMSLALGDIYIEPGANAIDNFDGNITANIITQGTVNTNILGTYTVTYNVTDSSGNAAITVTRTINVIIFPIFGNNPSATGATFVGTAGAGQFIYTTVGTFSLTPQYDGVVEVLVVAGGGGGGAGNNDSGGGAIVGIPGLSGEAGYNSSFATYIALGGGKGNYKAVGGDGGSGAGGSMRSYVGGAGLQPPSASGGFGYSGGTAAANDAGSGGGGGAGSAGGNAATNNGGAGGAGKNYSLIFGTAVGHSGWFASGGGGGANSNATPGSSLIGGGSPGAKRGDATHAMANTGGGGGGGGAYNGTQTYSAAGGNGGSGIVIVKWDIIN